MHRDIKPENLIFIEKDNISKGLQLIDFGFAKKLEPGEYLKESHGTPYYIAPDVLNFHYDTKCDIWSAGIILYIMLAGKPPFNGKEDTTIMGQIKSGTFKMRARDFRGVSEGAQAFIKRLM